MSENTNRYIPKLKTLLPEGYVWATDLTRDSQQVVSLINEVWPAYLTQQPDIAITIPHEPSLYARYLGQRYFVWGIRLAATGELVACLSCACLFTEQKFSSLDEHGWNWAQQASIDDENVNTLCLLSATVSPYQRSAGLAKSLVNSAKELAIKLGYEKIIVPARPSSKSQYPEMTLADYLVLSGHMKHSASNAGNSIGDKSVKSIASDPWITLHMELGAELVNICEKSVEITGSIKWWEHLLNKSLQDKQTAIIPDGLVPLDIDHKKSSATYREPNIWLAYYLTMD
jgi:hypothetical protein